MSAVCILSTVVVLALARSMKEEPNPRQLLIRPLEPGQAVIWYLYHSGWAVKTRNHLLIFDYTEPPERPTERSIDFGSIGPAEIGGLNVEVGAAEKAGARFFYSNGKLVPNEKTCVCAGAQMTR